ncbi:MAG: S8 family serine peptidase [Gaiellaceae bacterium MAG52_C11]|nr:S8 family serine peptidase [Candidatus Gaiellasilicea maunaloa]
MLAHVAALLVSASAASGASAVTFAAAVPSGKALAQLAASEEALVALTGHARAARLVRSRGGRLLSARLRLWKLSGAAAARLVPELERLGALRYAEPSRRRDTLVRFTDPLSTPDLSYHLPAIGADRSEPPGRGFPITILDSGIDLSHPDFAARPDIVLLNPQLVSGPDRDDYHGTEVASMAAAAVNGVGGEGVYPQALVRSYDVRDELDDDAVVAGIEAALAAGPSVINLSLGGTEPSRSLFEATLLALAAGSLVVAASGNELDVGNPTLYPAAFPHVLTVGASNRQSLPTVFSSSGPTVDLTAPGEELPFQNPRDPSNHYLLAGTSFSAPLVSAAAAWVRTVRGAMTIGQLANLLRFSARDVGEPGFDERTGYGVLDIPAALAAPLPPRDAQEPNDDVSHVVAGGLFARAKPFVSARFQAVLDETEDPRDVYRVSVPAGRRLTVRVVADDDVRVALFGPTARTVLGTRSRLAVADRAGRQPETVTSANRTGRSLVLFLAVSPGRARTIANPSYRVELTFASAPR